MDISYLGFNSFFMDYDGLKMMLIESADLVLIMISFYNRKVRINRKTFALKN